MKHPYRFNEPKGLQERIKAAEDDVRAFESGHGDRSQLEAAKRRLHHLITYSK